MKVVDQEWLRKRVYSYIENHSKRDTVHHFCQENIQRQVVYNIIKRYEDGLPAERAPKSGRPPKFNKQKLTQMQKLAKNCIGVSQRQLSRKFNVSQSTICSNLRKTNLKQYKRQKAPKYTDKQLETVPVKCRKLLNAVKSPKKIFVMDDEKYLTFSNSSLAGNAGFYTNDISKTPAVVRYAFQKKFEGKVLVWLAISAKGVSSSAPRRDSHRIKNGIWSCVCLN